MERKWLALANDPLPLRLGQVVDMRPKKRPVKVVDSREGPVKWSKDGPYMGSDYAHPVAPDCRNKTKAKVERAVDCGFDDLIDVMFGLDKIVPEMGVGLGASWTFFDNNGLQHVVYGAPTDAEVRDFYKRAALGQVSNGERSAFEARVVLRTPQRKFEQENLSKTATGLQMLMEAGNRHMRAILDQTRMATHPMMKVRIDEATGEQRAELIKAEDMFIPRELDTRYRR